MIRSLSHAVPRTVLLCLLGGASVAAFGQDANADIYGKWKIMAVIGMGAETILDTRQSKKLIGKPLLISAHKTEFNGQTCVPTYERSQEETAKHFEWAWRTDVSRIPFPNPVTIIDTGCNYIYPIRKDHLMIAEGNVFFEAVRVKGTANLPFGHSSRKQD